ncbi:MAG TPA: DNA polymerase [Chitinophagaceae bacterium]|nr:DNA polymerase [Chitinophagaceae bacterium]
MKGSELKKEGYYSVDENTLMSLKTKNKEHKKLIDTILKLAKLEKLVGTYFHGIPKKMNEFGWKDNYIHGQLNQVVARTGRTSSSNPNQQNLDPEFKKLCVSRYEII